MPDDFHRAQDAITALRLTGYNSEVAGQWLSFWKNGKPPSLDVYRRLTWLHTEAILIGRTRKNLSIHCVSAGPYFRIALNADLTGADLLAQVPPDQRAAMLAHWSAVVDGAVSVTYMDVKCSDGPPGIAQCVGLPFSGEDPDGGCYGLVHTNWRPSGTSWIAGNVEAGVLASTRQLVRFKD